MRLPGIGNTHKQRYKAQKLCLDGKNHSNDIHRKIPLYPKRNVLKPNIAFQLQQISSGDCQATIALRPPLKRAAKRGHAGHMLPDQQLQQNLVARIPGITDNDWGSRYTENLGRDTVIATKIIRLPLHLKA